MKSNNKFLLFDLGGVIINLDTHLTVEAFAKLGGRSEEDVITAWRKEEVFKKYETGHISDEDFRSFLRTWLKKPLASDKDLDEAWNAMILDLPPERLKHLISLKTKYHVMLLSNTNSIHMRLVDKRVKEVTGEEDLSPFFHDCYYSHKIGMRKPEPNIYNFILENHNINPSELLFLDDSYVNLQGAEAVGIRTLEVKDPNIIFRVEEYV